MKRLLALTVAAGLALAACSSGGASTAPSAAASTGSSAAPAESAAAGAGGLVGIAMPTKSSARWIADGDNLVEVAHGARLRRPTSSTPRMTSRPRSHQVENMITKGAKVLVIAAIDGTTLADTLQKAADAGIKVFAYDRLIRESPNVDYYAAFDNFDVGVAQAGSIVDSLDLNNAAGPFNIELFAGSPDDNNAGFFFNGAMSILQPLIDSGKLVVESGETKFPEQVGTLRWDGATAQARMDNILATHYADKRVDAVLSPVRRHQPRHHRLAEAGRLLRRRQARSRRHRPGRRAPVGQVDPRRRADLARCSRTPGPWPRRSPRWSTSSSRARPWRSMTPRRTRTASRSSRRTFSRSSP